MTTDVASCDAPPAADRKPGPRWETLGLGLLFGTLYFVQGIGEPSDGLIAQPVLSLLKSWGYGDRPIALFAAVLALPWAIKPLYGLLSDFVPLLGRRRKSYLLATTGAATAGMVVLATLDLPGGSLGLLLGLLLVPTTGIAFSDVVVDALMVQKGQPRGLTGQLQAVQWAAMYLAMIVAGSLGGYFSEHHAQRTAFAICAAVNGLGFLQTLLFVRESPAPRPSRGELAQALRAMFRVATRTGMLYVGGFLFLWNFNPFSTAVLYLHMTRHMGFSEQFYGHTVALLSAASIVACVAYGFYCRRVPFAWLVHASIVLGILATIAYWALWDTLSAVLVTLAVGFTYMTASLIQLDLAARVCPPQSAGTLFALLMALENVGSSSSTAVGGWLYDWGTQRWGPTPAFNLLVGIGALTTAACWCVVPALLRQEAELRSNPGSGS